MNYHLLVRSEISDALPLEILAFRLLQCMISSLATQEEKWNIMKESKIQGKWLAIMAAGWYSEIWYHITAIYKGDKIAKASDCGSQICPTKVIQIYSPIELIIQHHDEYKV